MLETRDMVQEFLPQTIESTREISIPQRGVMTPSSPWRERIPSWSSETASAILDMTPLVQAKTTNRLERPALPRSKGLGPRAAEIGGAYIPGLETSGFRGGKWIRETNFA